MDSRRTTNTLLVIVVIIIVIIGLLYFFLPSKTKTPETVSQTATTTVSVPSINYTTKSISENNGPKNYNIAANYPVFDLTTANAGKINSDVLSLVNKEVSSFKSSFDETSSFQVNDETSTFRSDFAVIKNLRISNILPIRFTESFYSAGAAHPGGNILTRNYNLSTGNNLNLADLFQPNADYLNAISSYSIKALETKLGDDAVDSDIESGAGPQAENFQAFLVTDDGLIVIFNEYQVAAYASGEQEITIPWGNLGNILNPSLNLI